MKFFPVAIAEGKHPIPSRTRKLSLPAPMILSRSRDGKVGRRRELLERPEFSGRFFYCIYIPSYLYSKDGLYIYRR